MNIILNRLPILLIALVLNSCVDIPNKHDSLAPGKWRAILKLYDKNYVPAELIESKQQLIYKELPFNFELSYDENKKLKIAILNAGEVLDIAEITVGIDRQTAKDTIVIDFPIFNSYIKAIHEEGIMEGHWHVRFKKDYKIPFFAQFGQDHRFAMKRNKANADISGKWKTTFEFDKEEDQYMAIAEFKQDGNELTGTFRTETGDYRYLQGNVIGNKFFLSTFDGAHAFLFEGLIQKDGSLVGIFKSGNHYTSNWIAERDDQFELTKAADLSQATIEEIKSFSFPNDQKKIISLSDDQYVGKYKLINIMGTWCPNCMDEINFLKAFKDSAKAKDFEIISLAFERFKEDKESFEALRKYKAKMNIDWEMLYGGYANKKDNQKVIPFIDKLISYPTLLILDRDNKIQYIHTGFSGPATSQYKNFIKEFDDIISKIQNGDS